jgi:ABC-type antimicrobial peptide transport system permease subunit
MVYSLQAGSDSNFILNVRTSANPGSIIGPVREALSSVAPGLAVLETGTLAEAVEEITAPERMTASLASLFGAMAALLAGIGTYGLLAYAVAQRRREIGIRMALGAKPGNVARLVARQTFAMTSVGVTAGLGGAMIAAPAFRSLLYGISPLDPVAMIVAGIFVIVVSALATVGPASQAVQIEPAEALRLEA